MPLAAVAMGHEHIELTAMPETVGVVADDLLVSAPTEAPLAMPNLSVNLGSTFETTQTVYVEVVADTATETHVQAWFEDSMGNWYNSLVDGFGPPLPTGFEVGPDYDMTTDFYVFADAAGTYTATLNVRDVVDDAVLDTAMVTVVASTSGAAEYWGADRYATALDISREGWDSSNVVILARGDLYPDALTGGSLAGHYNAPILLTHPDQLFASVRTEIERLNASTVILLGEEQALSAGVHASVDAIPGVSNVIRIGGSDRYQTADLIAARLISQLGVSFKGEAFVARGDDFPDALAGVPIAGAQGMPIFLVHSAHGMFSGTAAMIDQHVDEAIILGQTRAVSAATQTRLATMLGVVNVRRIGGVDRYDTAAQVAVYGVNEKGHTWNMAGIARGELFPDSLTGGSLQAKHGSIILLTLPTTVPSHTRMTLQTHAVHIQQLRIFGGPEAISATVRAQLKTYAGVN